MRRPQFSVIVPVYNSAASLKPLITEISHVFISANTTYEIVLVNDYSTDNSLQLINEVIAEKALPLVLINLQSNTGQYNATVKGLNAAQGSYLITIDDDFSPRPCYIQTLIDTQPNSEELIYGELTEGKRPLSRKAGSWAFNSFIKLNLNKKVTGNGSSFRLMSIALAQKVLQDLRNPVLLDITLINAANAVRFVTVPVKKRVTSSHSFFQLILIGISVWSAVLNKKIYFRKPLPV